MVCQVTRRPILIEMSLSRKKRPFPAGDFTWSCRKKKSKLLFLLESLVSKPKLALVAFAFGNGHIHSAEWDKNLNAMFLKCHYMFSRILKNYERSEKSDTVLLDEIKERVLHEDFDGTSESSVSIVTHMSAEQSRNYSKGRGSESTSRWVIKRRVLGYFRASDKELKLWHKRKPTPGAISTQMLSRSPNPDGVLSNIRQTRWASFTFKMSALIIRLWLLTLTCATNQAKSPPSVTRSGKCPGGYRFHRENISLRVHRGHNKTLDGLHW